ncbi:hypothetical protein Y032_0021g409 [Ancylostoma ceylanicum]|uniref:Uncharacterized protein n=1 Tax=Ancylostoma ceylanicum TaxID=53326 RepID=A0A016V0I3_9BILA|nr:hypothetical protein Y032_0021g409 [Ancylostoma ceylanicum]
MLVPTLNLPFSFRRVVALRSPRAKPLRVVAADNKLEQNAERNTSSSCEGERELSSDDESTIDLSTEVDHSTATRNNTSTTSTSSSDSEAINTPDEAQELDYANLPPVQLQSYPPEASTSGSSEECYLNVVVSVPDDVVDEFHFGDRLPPEILRLFPEFVDSPSDEIPAEWVSACEFLPNNWDAEEA